MKRPRILTLEESLEYLNEDEYCEVTPNLFVYVKRFLIKTNVKRKQEKEKACLIIILHKCSIRERIEGYRQWILQDDCLFSLPFIR